MGGEGCEFWCIGMLAVAVMILSLWMDSVLAGTAEIALLVLLA
jgi:hypothetical protein